MLAGCGAQQLTVLPAPARGIRRGDEAARSSDARRPVAAATTKAGRLFPTWAASVFRLCPFQHPGIIAGQQNPFGAFGATSMVLTFAPECALATLTPTKAAETAKTAASAILLSMVSPCGFVVAVWKPTRRVWRGGQTRGEQPANHGGNT